MDLYELLALILLLGGVWLWLDSLKTREIGMQAAQQACAEEGLQFLDETVVISSFRLARDDEGRLQLRRIYSFEYSDTGDNRRSGSVSMLGHRVEMLHVRPNLYVVPSATQSPNSHDTFH
ncbi:hypothetical protein AT959_02735 [Dechloromonas denitrificans]|uniref:DUF3301 domain-containing protein n=1 Tax=Dechloromonas denitrificans TaxID=281362 RepID=A0A133XM32_9RHOO|nr:DUF3301 domain-containing protein [Dechloromonas denitrificans]KXB31995.1 hypothetical protein AT959_02735 [Dechloromonas denitrificans]